MVWLQQKVPSSRTVLYTVALATWIFFTWIICDTSYEARFLFDQVFDYPATTAFLKPIRRIGFVGDSICLNDIYRRKISLLLQNHHPNQVFMPVDACIGGSNVTAIRRRAYRSLLRIRNIEAIFFMWDSDASDIYRYNPPRLIDGKGFVVPPSEDIKAAYKDDLAWLLRNFLDKTPRVAMAGPFLMGERVRGMNPFDHVYEVFLEINKDMAKRFNVTYFPFRDIFFSALPPGWDLTVVALRSGGPGGYLTIDGEHLNDRARDMVLEKYKQLLLTWFPGDDDVEYWNKGEDRSKLPVPRDYFSPSLFLPP